MYPTPMPYHYQVTTTAAAQKAMMSVDFTPIFLALLPLFLSIGTLLGLGLQQAETSSSTPNIRHIHSLLEAHISCHVVII